MKHILTQEAINKLAEIFVYLDLLKDLLGMLVLYEQLEINREESSADTAKWQLAERRFAQIEQRLTELEHMGEQTGIFLREIEKILVEIKKAVDI